jgi:hypothetical protein
MTPLFRKLNLTGHNSLVVINAPASFEAELASLSTLDIRRDAARSEKITFAIAFVQTLAEVQAVAETLLPRTEGDATVWFAYPKGTSRRYTCEFNRDTGWGVVRVLGFDTVRQVAIDDDWSALRFRRVAFIGR